MNHSQLLWVFILAASYTSAQASVLEMPCKDTGGNKTWSASEADGGTCYKVIEDLDCYSHGKPIDNTKDCKAQCKQCLYKFCAFLDCNTENCSERFCGTRNVNHSTGEEIKACCQLP